MFDKIKPFCQTLMDLSTKEIEFSNLKFQRV